MTNTETAEMDGEGEFLAGRLLIAMPGIGDPRFERAVILMCAHSADNAMGVTVNHPMDGLSLGELLDKLGVKPKATRLQQAVLSGGPVDRERGFVIHTADYVASDSTLPIGEGIALTPTREVLEAMVDAQRRPRQSILALGCATWGAGQLEEEIRQNVWLACEADESLVFGEDYDGKWARALAKIGVRADHLSAQAGSA